MEISETKSLLHWNYFLALESDVERLSRFVEFTSSNFGTYSVEIAHLFLATASEVDVVAKQLCSQIDGASKVNKIEQYRDVLRRCLPKLESSIVVIPRYGLEIKPWSKWQDNKTPGWWQSHNKVKHQRCKHFELASLENALNAVAGLFLLVLYYYRDCEEVRSIEPPPCLFTPPPDLAFVCPSLGGRMRLTFAKDHA